MHLAGQYKENGENNIVVLRPLQIPIFIHDILLLVLRAHLVASIYYTNHLLLVQSTLAKSILEYFILEQFVKKFICIRKWDFIHVSFKARNNFYK